MPRFKVAAIDSQGKGVVRHYDAPDEAAAASMARLELLRPQGIEPEMPEAPPQSPGTPLYKRTKSVVPLETLDSAPTARPVRRAGGMEHAPISTIASGILLSGLVFAPMVILAPWADDIARGPLADEGISPVVLRLSGVILTLVLMGFVFHRAIRGR